MGPLLWRTGWLSICSSTIGFALTHHYEPDCSDAYQDIVDYIQFEQETAEIWPWLISDDEILAHETTLREIAGRLAAAGEWDTESIYDGLTEAFGNNPSLNNPSEFSPKPIACRKEESTIKITQNQLDLLWQLEEFRKKHEHQAEPSDWAIRMCEAFVARSMGFTDRTQWTELLRQRGETLFTFDWKSGSISDHVAQWCRENHRDWRYSHLGELQVAHSGEWKKVDYFCANGGETRVYFPAEPVQEQQLQALAEDPAVHLRDLLTLGLPEHDVYLVHASADVGWVPAADLGVADKGSGSRPGLRAICVRQNLSGRSRNRKRHSTGGGTVHTCGGARKQFRRFCPWKVVPFW